MEIKIFSFTDKGRDLSQKLVEVIPEYSLSIAESREELQEAFLSCGAIIFVGALGMAIRLINPYIKDKLTDPAVVVLDEMGQFVIPVLSGHVGGANDLSRLIAVRINGIPVITTATDVNNVFAIDEFAAKNDLQIVNRDNIKKVSGGLLKGRPVNVAISDDVLITKDSSELDEKILGLIYRPLVLGIGLRRGKDFTSLEEFVINNLKDCGRNISDVCAIASIDLKSDEPALLQFSNKYNIPITFFSADELNAVEGEFEESDFVMNTVGVSEISGRAAKALGKNGNFILKKEKNDGMTISIFEKYRRITFEY